jgi:hypothetical protein
VKFLHSYYRWPVSIVLVLFVTICVNVAFAFVAIQDKGGGFELVNQDEGISSYKMKRPLTEK